MKTFSAKPADVTRNWYVIDATEVPLGRLATRVAKLLTGKGKPEFTPHVDCGDYVVIINAKDVVVSGKKADQKVYYRHSGYPGSLKERTLSQQMEKDPSVVIKQAVRGMIPANKLRDGKLARLKVYTNETHEHEAQKPQKISIKDVK